jgi:hypothetical protein
MVFISLGYACLVRESIDVYNGRLVVDRKMAPDEPNSSHQALEDLIVFLQPKPPSFIEQHAGSIVMVLLMLTSLIAMIF